MDMKKRSVTLPFLERFKGKIHKISRHSGLLGALSKDKMKLHTHPDDETSFEVEKLSVVDSKVSIKIRKYRKISKTKFFTHNQPTKENQRNTANVNISVGSTKEVATTVNQQHPSNSVPVSSFELGQVCSQPDSIQIKKNKTQINKLIQFKKLDSRVKENGLRSRQSTAFSKKGVR